jgi:hypothetical protein
VLIVDGMERMRGEGVHLLGVTDLGEARVVVQEGEKLSLMTIRVAR